MRRFPVIASSIGTSLGLALSGLAISPVHANGGPIDGTYVCSTGVLTATTESPTYQITSGVVSNGSSCTGEVVIAPGSISIGSAAFYSAISLTKVTLPASLTSVGDQAFASSLTSIVVDAGNTNLESVDGVLFNKVKTTLVMYPRGRTSTSYVVPANVISIGRFAFADATLLESVTLPATLTTISTFAFYSAKLLKTLVVPEGVTSIDDYAFAGATSLTSITLPVSLKTIGYSVFKDATSLISIDVAEDNNDFESVGGVLFNKAITTLVKYPPGKTDISYVVPASVTTIGGEAFYYATSLTSITLPAGLTHIDAEAFRKTTSLASITIPESVTSIGYGTFTEATALTDISIPIGVTKIDNNMFNGATSLTSATLPAGLTQIDYSAFEGTTSLASIIIPDSVTTIGYRAFSGATSLTAISIPIGVTKIDDLTFSGATSLTSVTLPAGLTTIGFLAFSDTRLTSVTLPAGVTSIGDYGFSGIPTLTSITLPDSLTSIGDGAFFQVTALTSITIPASVQTIGRSAFMFASSLADVSFASDSQLTLINIEAFRSTGITSVVIPAGVTSIGEGAFNNTTSLTSVTIPASVTTIDPYVFFNASSLSSIHFEGNAPTVGVDAFTNIGTSACSVVKTGATGFGTAGSSWNGLSVVMGEYKVTHDSKGGSPVACNAFATVNSAIDAPTEPTRDGYTFTGWSATDGGTAITFPHTPGVATDVTLYAIWTAISDDETTPPVVEPPAPVVEPPAPVTVVEPPAPVVNAPARVVEPPAPVVNAPAPVVDTAAQFAAADLAKRTVGVKKSFAITSLAVKVGVSTKSPKAKVTFSIAKSSKKICVKSGTKIKTLKVGKCVVTFSVQEPKPKAGKTPKAKRTVKTLVVR